MKKQKSAQGVTTRLLKMLLAFYPRLIPLILVLIFVNAIISALPAVFQQQVVAVIQESWEGQLTWMQAKPEIYRLVFLLAGLYVGALLAGFLYNQLMAVFTQGALDKIRGEMFAHMQKLPIRYFDTHVRGDVMSYYTNDVDALRQMISQSFPQLLISFLTVLTILAIMLYYSVWMAPVIVGGCDGVSDQGDRREIFALFHCAAKGGRQDGGCRRGDDQRPEGDQGFQSSGAVAG